MRKDGRCQVLRLGKGVENQGAALENIPGIVFTLYFAYCGSYMTTMHLSQLIKLYTKKVNFTV